MLFRISPKYSLQLRREKTPFPHFPRARPRAGLHRKNLSNSGKTNRKPARETIMAADRCQQVVLPVRVRSSVGHVTTVHERRTARSSNSNRSRREEDLWGFRYCRVVLKLFESEKWVLGARSKGQGEGELNLKLKKETVSKR